jgi:D-sedoheptulose 7-phosphate isomerase
MDRAGTLASHLDEHREVMDALRDVLPKAVEAAALLDDLIAREGHLFICGNGGSAADSQHWAGEWRGKLHRDRRPLRATSLTVDTSTITAIANDYGYDHIFARQLRALAKSGDVLVAISTSGNSPNVMMAAEAAREIGVKVIGMTGQSGGKLAAIADLMLAVPSSNTQRIQEAHGFLMHVICELNDAALGG